MAGKEMTRAGVVVAVIAAVLCGCATVQTVEDGADRPWLRKYWQADDPLYKELFSDEPRTYPDESGFIWMHMFYPQLPTFALQYGVPYSVEDTVAELSKHNLNLYSNGRGAMKRPKHFLDLLKKYDVQFVMYGPVHNAGRDVNPHKTKEKRILILDPVNIKRLKELTAEYYNMAPEMWWALSLGDEPISYMKKTLFAFVAEKTDYPFVKQGLIEMKEKYGYGKFGMPSSGKAPNEPFQWIALNRWFNDQWLNVVKGFAETVKSLDPNMPVIGEDSVSRLRTNVFERSAKWVDISTGQNHPGREPFRQELAFKTKVQCDLTMKEVWLTPHIENFDGMHTAEEITYFLSEIARVGGTGLQLWNSDYQGWSGFNYSFYDRYGAPDRWQAIMNGLDRFNEMPKLRFPKPDTAIYFSNDASWSRDRAVYFQPHYEGAFTFLGPFARAWFEFVSDENLREKMKSLDKFSNMFIPFATFQDKEMSEYVTKYAESGKDVVCGDPEVSRYHLDGSETPEYMRRMFGVKLAGLKPFPDHVLLRRNAVWPKVKDGQRMPVFGPVKDKDKEAYGNAEDALAIAPDMPKAFNIELDPGVEVLGVYPDGSPAIVLKQQNGGRAIYFAFNPFIRRYIQPRSPEKLDEYQKLAELVQNLASEPWVFTRDPENRGSRQKWYATDYDRSAWKPIKIVGTWEKNGHDKYDGHGWYAVKFTAPERRRGKRYTLHFDGVDESAWVYLNGALIAQRYDFIYWNKPFTVDVTRHLRFGAENDLVVHVQDRRYAGGIYKPVRLFAIDASINLNKHDITPAWAPVMVSLIKGLGIKTGHDIWRFQFPMPRNLPDHSSDTLCLTGNHFYWDNNFVHEPYNAAPAGAVYSYTLNPDEQKEQTGVREWYTFDEGDLMDRRDAHRKGNVDKGRGGLSDWVVSWKRLDEFGIVLDLQGLHHVKKVRLVYSGELPEVTLSAGPSVATLSAIAKVEARGLTPMGLKRRDVLELVFNVDAPDTVFVRIDFGQRNKDELILSEVEIWGDKPE